MGFLCANLKLKNMERTVVAFSFLLLAFHTIADVTSDVDSTTMWNQIEIKFLGGNIIEPARYKANILVQLKGNVTSQDSVIFHDFQNFRESDILAQFILRDFLLYYSGTLLL